MCLWLLLLSRVIVRILFISWFKNLAGYAVLPGVLFVIDRSLHLPDIMGCIYF